MSRVRVVTDSAASVPDSLAQQLDVSVVPLHLTGDGGSEPDRPTVGAGEVGGSTAAPSPGEWIEAFTADGTEDGVVAVTVASSMSATHLAAESAARSTGGRVLVVDSGTAAAGEALVVVAAARRAAEGATLEEVAHHAAVVADGVRLVATLSSLEHLARSGRVPRVAADAGRVLRVNPVFEFRHGQVRRRRPALSRDAALGRVAAAVGAGRPSGGGAGCLHVAAMVPPDGSISGEGLLELVRSAVGEATPIAGALLCETGAVIARHTGPTVAGVAWWWEVAG
jgi:DegV family protein with EDD domain